MDKEQENKSLEEQIYQAKKLLKEQGFLFFHYDSDVVDYVTNDLSYYVFEYEDEIEEFVNDNCSKFVYDDIEEMKESNGLIDIEEDMTYVDNNMYIHSIDLSLGEVNNIKEQIDELFK